MKLDDCIGGKFTGGEGGQCFSLGTKTQAATKPFEDLKIKGQKLSNTAKFKDKM